MSADDTFNDYRASAPHTGDPAGQAVRTAHAFVNQPADTAGGIRSVPAPEQSRPRPPSRRNNLLISLAIALLMVVILGAGGLLFYLDRSFEGKIYPNITIQGLKVGMLTPQEAEAALRTRYGDFIRQPAVLTFAGQTWKPTLDDLGVSFDFGGAANSAFRSGRDNGLVDNVREVATIWEKGLELPLRVAVDQQKVQQYVSTVTASLEQPPADAALLRSGTLVRVQPAQVGRQVLLNETVATLTEALLTLKPQTVDIRTRDILPRLNDTDAELARRQLETMLEAPITMQLGNDEIVWSPDELALMVTTARVPKDALNDQIEITINTYQIERRLWALAEATKVEGTRPRLAWNGGDLKITKAGLPGKRLDEQTARDMIVAAINGSPRDLTLPMVAVPPPITEANLDTLGIKELVSLGKSDFTGSASYRITNIGAGMNMINGILIGPGEEFSFNDNIGAIDETNGFVKGYAIVENRTQLEFGGGVCQDSTTVFRAAFWAGLPFTEWRGHQFYISWYDKYALGSYGNGSGMDATIFTGPGGQDLKFLNDTGNWLLLQAGSNAKSGLAEVALYGTKPNRTVELRRKAYDAKPAITAPVFAADPKQPRGTIRQSDTARGGLTVDIERVVYDNGVARKPDLFRTRYEPWPNIFAVHPEDLGPDGWPRYELLPDSLKPLAPTQPTPMPADGSQPPPADGSQPQPAPADGTQPPPPADGSQPQPTPPPSSDG